LGSRRSGARTRPAQGRDQIDVLLKELAADRAELRFHNARIADLETQIEAYRQQLARVVTAL
jgi:ribosomal protein L29